MNDVNLIGDFILYDISYCFVEKRKIIGFCEEYDRLIFHLQTRPCHPIQAILLESTLGDEIEEDFDQFDSGEHDEYEHDNNNEINSEISHNYRIKDDISDETSKNAEETEDDGNPRSSDISGQFASLVFQQNVGDCKERHNR